MIESDEVREKRIQNEVIVDAYESEEQALGWYYYLEEHLRFPFKARCVSINGTSPLKLGETIKVVGMANESDCTHDMIVMVQLGKRTMGVPLLQLEPLAGDQAIIEAIKDWHYWVSRGYTF